MKRIRSPDSEPDAKQTNDASEGWTRVEKRKAKKIAKQAPHFFYVNNNIQSRRDPVYVANVRDLALHLAADAPPQDWLKVENRNSVTKLVVLFIPGISPEHLNLPPRPTSATRNPNLPLVVPETNEKLPFISKVFSHACPTRAPGDVGRMHSILGTLFSAPVSGEEKRKRAAARIQEAQSFEKNPTRYLLSPQQMLTNDYPLPSYMSETHQETEGWVETPEPDPEPSTTVYGIDCEMCITQGGKALTRVCVVDYATDKVVLDELVKPPDPITDYLTRFSGIVSGSLDKVTTTLADVQKRVLDLVSVKPTPMLLGHSLEQDLMAVKLRHPRCLDTALMYNHPRGPPLKPGLAWLTRKWCGREIQNRGESGHDPEEDARACLDLLRKKVENGPGYGEFKIDSEPIFVRLKRAGKLSVVVDHGSPNIFHGEHASCVPCTTDDEVLAGMLTSIPSHDFVFGRFLSLADAQGWTTQKATNDPESARPIVPLPVDEALSKINGYLSTIHTSLTPRTALMIFSGHSDPRTMLALQARKSEFETALRSSSKPEDVKVKWTTENARELEEAAERAKQGLLFLCLKK